MRLRSISLPISRPTIPRLVPVARGNAVHERALNQHRHVETATVPRDHPRLIALERAPEPDEQILLGGVDASAGATFFDGAALKAPVADERRSEEADSDHPMLNRL